MNISSAVVKTRPEHLAEVTAALLRSSLCDIHFSEEMGRIMITIEGDNDNDESTKLKPIAELVARLTGWSITCCRKWRKSCWRTANNIYL